jgi:hypothetical protein
VVLAVVVRCVMGDGALVTRGVGVVWRRGHGQFIVAEATDGGPT